MVNDFFCKGNEVEAGPDGGPGVRPVTRQHKDQIMTLLMSYGLEMVSLKDNSCVTCTGLCNMT